MYYIHKWCRSAGHALQIVGAQNVCQVNSQPYTDPSILHRVIDILVCVATPPFWAYTFSCYTCSTKSKVVIMQVHCSWQWKKSNISWHWILFSFASLSRIWLVTLSSCRNNHEFYHHMTDVSITSLSYNLWSNDAHLAVGLRNGKIKVYSGLTNSSKLLVSLEVYQYWLSHILSQLITYQASRAVTCLTFSKDGRILAAGCSSGQVKLWKGTQCMSHWYFWFGPEMLIKAVPASPRSETQGISLARGKLKRAHDDGYAISVPSGTTEGKTITFKHKPVPDFEFSDGTQPVMVILFLHSSEDCDTMIWPEILYL